MAITENMTAWIGHCTKTTVRLCAFVNDTGTLTFTFADGTVYSQAVTPVIAAPNFGVYSQDIAGLAIDTRYTVQVALDGVNIETLYPRTFPNAGTKASMAFISCVSPSRMLAQGADFETGKEHCYAIIHLGDTPYADSVYENPLTNTRYHNINFTPMSEGATENSNYTDQEMYFVKTLAYWQRPDMKWMRTTMANYLFSDDHQVVNDWDHTTDAFQLKIDADGELDVITQQIADDTWWRAMQVHNAFAQGNPDHIDGVAAEKPHADCDVLVGTSVDQYPVSFFRFTIGDAEIFGLDTLTCKGPNKFSIISGGTGGDSQVLGVNQLAWLQAKLAASTAAHKVILSGKKTLDEQAADGWELTAATQRDTLLGWINTNITGCHWWVGDVHDADVSLATVAADGFDHTCFNIAPTGQSNQTPRLASPHSVAYARILESPADENTYVNCHGVLTIHGSDTCQIRMYRPDGDHFYNAYVDSDSLLPRPPSY